MAAKYITGLLAVNEKAETFFECERATSP